MQWTVMSFVIESCKKPSMAYQKQSTQLNLCGPYPLMSAPQVTISSTFLNWGISFYDKTDRISIGFLLSFRYTQVDTHGIVSIDISQFKKTQVGSCFPWCFPNGYCTCGFPLILEKHIIIKSNSCLGASSVE